MDLGKLFYTIALEGMDEFKQDVQSTENQTEQSKNKLIDAFKKIGAAVATYLSVQQIVAFGKAVVDAAATVSAEASAFEQIMGDYSDKAQEKMQAVADATGVVDTRLTTYMTSMTAKFKGLGFDIDDATTLAQEGLMLASDAAAFWDKSLDESMSHLNSFINGSYEGGEAIGLFANDTQMAQYAVRIGLVETTSAWAALDEATKQATRLEYAKLMYEQSGATGQAAKEADQYANVQANLTEKWRQFKAMIGEPVLQNIVLPAMQRLSGMIDTVSTGIQNLIAWIDENRTTYELLKGAVIALTTAVGAFVLIMKFEAIMSAAKTAITAVKTAMMALNTTFAANPIGLVVAAIAGLVAMFIYLWNNCEEFRNFWINTWEAVKTKTSEIWNGIKSAIVTPIENAKTKIAGIIDTVKGFFNGLKISWPKIPLPHFGISPSGWKIGDLLKGSIPKLGIEWYAKGAVLEQPSVIGYRGSNAMVAGEAGPEAVAPISTLMEYIRSAVAESQGGQTEVLQNILEALKDRDWLKRVIIEALNDGGFKIILDGREVGRIVKKYA